MGRGTGICSAQFHSTVMKSKIVSFSEKCLEPGITMKNKISQMDKYDVFPLICGIQIFFFKVHLYDMKLGGTVEGKEGVEREKAMRQGVVVRMGIPP